MIEIQISNDRVRKVQLRSSSAMEEDATIEAWRQIRDLIEAAHDRLRHAGEIE